MKSFLFIILAFACFACSDYLDIKPYGKTIPTTAEEFEAIIHTSLDDLDYGRDNMLLGDSYDILMLEAYTDNIDANIIGQSRSLPVYVGERLNTIMTDYTRYYSLIKDVNLVIDNVSKNDTLNKNILGTAHAIRGVAYLQLLRTFSPAYNPEKVVMGVPLVKSFDIEEQALRSTFDETVDYIVSDFKQAIDFNVSFSEFRFTCDVAKFYLARTYFWSQQWSQLITLLEPLIDQYPLLEAAAYADMLNQINTLTGNTLLKSYIYSDGSTSVSYSGTDKMKISRPVSASFINLFVEKERDIRYALSFNDQRETTKILNARIRGAELHFMLAEAYLHSELQESALNIINNIRDKRIEDNQHFTMDNLPEVPDNYIIKHDCIGNELTPLEYLLFTERQKEFFMEGDRWWELKRNGSPEFYVIWTDGLKYTTFNYMYTAPIYKQDVDLNYGLIQNEGYEE